MSLCVRFDEFYLYDEMVAFLREAESEYPELVHLTSLATTPEKRDVLLAEVTDTSTGPAEDKPAYYVQGGLHAQEGAGTTAALDVIRALVSEPSGRELLRKVAFYIVPRVNPDGMEYALTTRGAIRSRIEILERKNGLIPKDMDGDGRILSMRWEDPAGQYREDKEDPRILVRREPGDAGPFYNMVTEGEIRDYDGTAIASGTRTIDMNRNYAINWKATAVSSAYPFSEPEVRAVGDFTLGHANIFAGVDFHCGTNAILRLTTASDAELDQGDLEQILRIGSMAENVTGLPLMSVRDYGDAWRKKDILPGNSNHWAYFRLGISHYVVELGNGFNSAGITAQEYFLADARTRAKELMRRVLACHDAHDSEIFSAWRCFEHPQLGPIEIGGILQGNAYWMVAQCMEAVIPRTTAFVLRHAQFHPELILTDVEVAECGQHVYRIRAAVANVGGVSTNVMQGGGSEDVRQPVRLSLDVPEGVHVLSRSPLFEFSSLGAAGGKGYGEWFVRGPEHVALTLRATHPRAGVAEKRILTPTVM